MNAYLAYKGGHNSTHGAGSLASTLNLLSRGCIDCQHTACIEGKNGTDSSGVYSIRRRGYSKEIERSTVANRTCHIVAILPSRPNE